MFLLYSYISAVLFFSSYSYGANILAALPTPLYSHQIAYTHIWRELSLRGHNVTLITTDPLKDPKLTNLTEIDMRWMYSLMADISTTAEDQLVSTWKIHNWVHDFSKNVSEAHLSHSTISDLIRNRQNSFDVVLTEFLYAEFLAFAVIYECPKILFSSLETFVSFHNAMGNNIHPALYPDIGLPFSVPRNFRERVESTLYTLHSMLSHSRKIFPMKDQHIKNFFNLTVTTQSLIHEADMLFLNVNPFIQNIRAIGPTTINIGDLRRTLPIKPLPEDLKNFLDGAKNGFIYFSLGSNVKSKELRKESLNSIMQALGEMPYKVLWKFEDDYLPGKPQNVKLVKWAPQQAVLAHPNIKLFVTQGGLQSMEEGIFAEVPFVVIPFFADQDQNAHLMQQKGIAVVVDRFPHIEKEELKTAMLEVLNNPSYRNAVKRLKHLAMDIPMTGLETAVWWIEYVIRHKGAKHLRNPAANLPFYQYYLIDVIGFLVTAAAVVLTVLFILVRKFIGIFKVFIIDNAVATTKKLQ